MKGGTLKRILCLLSLALWTAHAAAGEVHVSAASSFKEVGDELTERFAGTHPGVKFLKNYGGSGALAKQVENGAPADIFISASLEWMEYLKKHRLVDTGSIGTFACNALVVVGSPRREVSAMKDLLQLERIAIGSPKSVPAGAYAMDALKNAGIDRRLGKKLVMARDVRECLMYAERGEVDGAFVYRTDALQAKHARILFAVPQDLYPKVVCPMSLTVAGACNADAAAFYRFLQSGEARSVLAKYGFDVK
jgi:molybdate transport system substrate-binding protein